MKSFSLKLKIDENPPANCAVVLRNAGHAADTAFDERLEGADDSLIASRSRAEDRILVRPKRQDKRMVLRLMERLVLALANRTPSGELWIVQTDRIRFRVQ